MRCCIGRRRQLVHQHEAAIPAGVGKGVGKGVGRCVSRHTPGHGQARRHQRCHAAAMHSPLPVRPPCIAPSPCARHA
eukprot:365950-Chlamydomonas_euryale.AAC.12